MSASAEDVLLVVQSVHYRKQPGTLYVLTSRLAWSQLGRDDFALSIHYSDVEKQKVSPAGKSKVQLQLVLLSLETVTLHFAAENQELALKDRDCVKDLLTGLLRKFKNQTHQDLEMKIKLLQERPDMYRLYKDLVTQGVVSADEFWSTRKDLLKTGSKDITGEFGEQATGVANAFLADVQPQSDGCNSIKYNLTPDVILSIFRVYPSVETKYRSHVPHDMSEKEFWTKFFQSHYFHRDRISFSAKELFSDCAKWDDSEVKAVLNKQKNNDSSIDAFLRVHDLEEDTLFVGDGFGTKSNLRLTGESTVDGKETNMSASAQSIHSLISRTNQHSTRVLQLTSTSATTQGDSSTPADTEDRNDHEISQQNKRRRLHELTSLDDLQPVESSCKPNLDIIDKQALQPVESDPLTKTLSQAECTATIRLMTSQIGQYCQQLAESGGSTERYCNCPLINPLESSKSSLIGGPVGVSSGPSISRDLRPLYMGLSELLRHFWTCFPITSAEAGAKAERMIRALTKYKEAWLLDTPISSSSQSIDSATTPSGGQQTSLTSPLPNSDNSSTSSLKKAQYRHLERMIQAAMDKYTQYTKRGKPQTSK